MTTVNPERYVGVAQEAAGGRMWKAGDDAYRAAQAAKAGKPQGK